MFRTDKMAAPMDEMMENHVKDFMENTASESKHPVNSISKALVDGDVKLITFIEKLQKYLTSTDVKVRAKCVRMIGEVLHQLPSSQLTGEEVELLVTYMCERLIDHHSVQPPALYALLALSGCKNFPDGLASRICRIIFQNVHNQSLSQGDRCNVYTILACFLETRMEELRQMEADFVLGFIQAMDTEKDPRNLIICFQCARTIIINFSLGNFVEEMFEVTSCYFPIDFTPPPNDAYKITRDDLIKGLRGCLSATEKFGEFAYPLLLEKLTSDIPSAKLDSLKTLSECVEIYGIKHLREFQSSLYNCIKNEVFSSGSPALEKAGLEGLKRMVHTLSKSSMEGDDSPVNVFVTEILQDCKRYMTGEDTRLLVPVCRLLEASAQGSDRGCCLILQDVLPCLIDIYNKSSVNSQRKSVLDMISNFVKVVCDFPSGKCQKILLTYLEDLSTLIRSALTDSSSGLRLTGVSGVNEMIKANPEQVQVYTNLILEKAFKDEDKEVRKSCLKPLKTLAEASSEIVQKTILPRVLESLKDPHGCGEGDDSSDLLEILSTVTLGYKPFVAVSTELLQIMSGISSKGTTSQCLEQKTKDLVQCLYMIIQNNIDSQESHKYMYTDFILRLYKTVIEGSMYDDYVLQSLEVVSGVCRCVQCIACRCTNSELKELYTTTTIIFLHGNLSNLNSKVEKFFPFDVQSPWQQTQLVSLTTPVVCCYSEQLPDEADYAQKLLTLSQSCSHRPTQISACKCLAGIVNKHPHVLTMFDIDELQKTAQCQTSQSRRQAVQLLIWLTKALVLRGHSSAQSLVIFMMTLLSDPDVGSDVADGFDTILTDSEDVLAKSMNAVIRMMYKQRLFVENVTNLVKAFEKANQESRKNYLKVLSSMLKNLPKQVLLTELPPLFPLMIHSLMSNDLELQISTMDTFYDLTHDAPEVVSSHIDSLIPQLLKLAGNQLSMKLRQSALQCLGVLTVLPTHIVLPYKTQVIRGLEQALDDKKRLVRKEAVTARNEWFLLGTSSK